MSLGNNAYPVVRPGDLSGVAGVVFTDGARFLGPVEGIIVSAEPLPGGARVLLDFTFVNETEHTYQFQYLAYRHLGMVRQRPLERTWLAPGDTLHAMLTIWLTYHDVAGDRPTVSARVLRMLADGVARVTR